MYIIIVSLKFNLMWFGIIKWMMWGVFIMCDFNKWFGYFYNYIISINVYLIYYK